MADLNLDEADLTVTFDSGASVKLDIRTRDLVRLEELDPGYAATQNASPRAMFLLAHVTLLRMGRNNQLPADVTVPADFDAFLDVVDIDADEPKPAPKARRRAAKAGT